VLGVSRFVNPDDIAAELRLSDPHAGDLAAARELVRQLDDLEERALVLEAHHPTHIEGTRLTLEQAERLWVGERVPEADPDDARELLNYRGAFEQALALGLVLEHTWLTIREYEAHCPGVAKRTLQRDLKAMVGMGLLAEGGTGPTDPTRHYRLADGVLEPGEEL